MGAHDEKTTAGLDPAVLARLRVQFARASAEPASFAAAFYARLFFLAPLTRALFREHLTTQGDRFMAMMTRLLDEADRPEAFAATVAGLADAHRPHGLIDEDALPVIEALLAELRHRLGDEFDAASADAWRQLLQAIVAPMLGTAPADA